ncbi:MAG: exonuclease domain-containing protein [Candidatus Izemoplasmatales bacterium]|jgi:sporulation inhibitor KapD
MKEYCYGLLHGVDEVNRLIAIKTKRKIDYYYLARSMFADFMAYFRPGIYVFLQIQKSPRIYKRHRVRNVLNIEKIMEPYGQKPKLYYDISLIKSGISAILNTKKPKLFLDFEMSMPPYRNYQNFVSEIIQIGLVLIDEEEKIIEEFSAFIKPKLFSKISERTAKFLSVSQAEIDAGIAYQEVHDLLKRIQRMYRPMVFVWGKNDELELAKMNRLYELDDFTRKMQFIDLLRLHKTYFGLKNDLGLFNAYKAYKGVDLTKQKHDAFQDASVTLAVFSCFKAVTNGLMTFTFENRESENEQNN